MSTVARLCRPAAGRLALAALAGVGASACGIGLMAAAAWLIARAAQHPPVLHLTVAIVAVRAFGIGRAVLRYAERLAGHDAAFRVLGSVRTRAFTALERVAPAGLRDLRSGDVVSRFVSDMDAAMDLLTRVVLPYLVAAVVGAATAAFLAALLPAAGVVVLVGLLVVAAAVPMLQAAAARRAESRIAPLRGELSAQVVELVHGAPDLLAYGAAPARLAELRRTDERLSRSALRSGSSVGVGAAVIAAVAGRKRVGRARPGYRRGPRGNPRWCAARGPRADTTCGLRRRLRPSGGRLLARPREGRPAPRGRRRRPALAGGRDRRSRSPRRSRRTGCGWKA